jgi:two-component system OmpR family response regulator
MSRRALIIDDMEIVARALSSILNLERFEEVHVVTDPRQAVRSIRELDPDLVVLDVRMPHVTGAQVIEALGPRRNHRPGLLMYSATPRDELDQQLKKSGLSYDAFLEKPSGLKGLKAAVQQVMALVEAK